MWRRVSPRLGSPLLPRSPHRPPVIMSRRSASSSTTAMLAYEASLPSLPIPELESTAAKYLESTKPHLTPSEFRATSLAVEDFLRSPLVRQLQQRLQEYAAAEEKEGRRNWLSKWWSDIVYLGYRDPVVVFVSYFYVHLKGREGISREERAAELVRALVVFRDLVESGKLEPEKVRGTPLAMSSYQWLFNSTRLPTIPVDTAQKYPPETNNHLLVLRKNRFYTLPTHTSTGGALSIPQLTSLISQIVSLADSQPPGPEIGALTSENRDTWSKAREHLASIGNNRKTLEKIDSAIMVLCLDDTSPETREELSWASWTGNKNYKGPGAGNRWFDKHQLLVWDNARSGFLGEHSCMDGTPTLRMTEFMIGSLAAGKIPRGDEASGSSVLPKVEELKFEVDEKAATDIESAVRNFEELVGNHELEVLQYEKLGKNACKKFKVSPDATAQLVKQLAFHRLYNRPGVCYESCQTRKFALGRTEVIRPASSESKAWAEAMSDASKTNAERIALFRKAVNRHLQYAAWAADGQGIDRHLFGLKRQLKEGEETPRLYEDIAYSRTSHWEMSTSNLSSRWLDGWGYGEVVPDGYGLSYSIGDGYIRWTMTCLKDMSRKSKGAKDLKKALEEAAEATRQLLESSVEAPKAKL